MSTGVAVRAQTATERCPWCDTLIPRPKFIEIESRFAEQQRKKLSEERVRIQHELRVEMEEAEIRIKEEAAKKIAALVVERDGATAKIKQLEAREPAIHQEAVTQTEARLNAEADRKLAALIAERDQATARIMEIEAAKKKDLEQLRAALERDRDAQVRKVEVQHNREREQLLKKNDALTRLLQRKTADDLGEGAETDVYEALRDAYPSDDIARIKKGQPGADIRHRVLEKGTHCGTIIMDSKNRQGWQNGYLTKLREDQMAAKADFAVLATTVFPSGRKEFYTDQETRVIVVNRARAVETVGLLRRLMIRMHELGMSQNDRVEKRELLYKYITSDNFRQHVIEAGRLTSEMLDLDVEEKRAHDKVWEKRGKMTTRLRNVTREIDTEVSAILEDRPSSTYIKK